MESIRLDTLPSESLNHGLDEESADPVQVANQQPRPEFSLPQADGGRDAWLFLGACFIVEALIWGIYKVSFS
jgi:hypothetical protein